MYEGVVEIDQSFGQEFTEFVDEYDIEVKNGKNLFT